MTENMLFNDKNQMVLILFKNIQIWPSYGRKWHACPYFNLSIRFMAITQRFFGKLGWNVYGNSGDYYLSIGGGKSKLWC